MTKLLSHAEIERAMDEECGPVCKHNVSMFKDCLSCDEEKTPHINEARKNLPIPLEEWVKERLANCLRIAEEKSSDEDRASWLEDAVYFDLILKKISKNKIHP